MSIPVSFRHMVRASVPAAAILLQASAVHAQESVPPEAMIPEPGLSYVVRDVAANDSLNVRSQPGANSDLIARLPHDARGIPVTGRWMAEGPSVWWEVITTGGQATTGWVNHRYLAVEPGEAQSTYPLQCTGTEPFWSLRLDDGHAAYSSPETQLLTLSASGWIRSRNSPSVFAIHLSSDGDGPAGDGYATLDRTACSDSMSGFEYPFEATVIMPDRTVLDGCCSRAASP